MLPPEHQKNLDNVVGAKRDNSNFFTVSRLPDTFWEFKQGTHLIYVAMAFRLFMSSFCHYFYVLNALRRGCHWCSVIPVLLQQVKTVQILLRRLWVLTKVLRFPEGNQVKVYHVPSEVKGNCS